MIFVFLLVFTVVYVLILGVVMMGCGGAISKKYSSKLMIARVILQFLTIMLLLVIFIYSKK